MRLQRRLQKVMALAAVTTVAFTAVPAFATDYKGHWAENVITEWTDRGIVAGYDEGVFKPENQVTRAELAAFITRIFGLEDASKAKVYGDIKTNDWYVQVVQKVSSANIMNDYGTQFKPNVAATREEAAYAIAKAYKMTNGEAIKFTDKNQISAWSVDEIAALVGGNYIVGRPDGSFGPKDSLTRAEFVSMIDKITAELYNKAGTYTANVNGNVVVNTKDVVLKDMTITGNLYLAEGIGMGDATLNNVKVTGKVFVEGGGINSIKLQNTILSQVEITKAVGNVRIVADAKSEVKALKAESPAKLEGKFGKVEVATKQPMEFVGATVEEVKVTAKDASVKFDEKSVVTKFVAEQKVAIENKGQIKEAEIKANGVKVTGKQPDKTQVADTVIEKPDMTGATKPEEKPANNGGGGGGGGGGTPTPTKKDMKFEKLAFYRADGSLIRDNVPAIKDGQIKVGFYNQNSLVVNSEALVTNGEILGVNNVAQIKVTSSNVTDKVKVYAGRDSALTSASFEPGKGYTEKDLISFAQSRQAGFDTTINDLEKLGSLTAGEAKRAREIMKDGYTILENAGASQGVEMENVMDLLVRIQNKLNDPDVAKAYPRLAEKLEEMLGVTIHYNNDKVQSITGTLEFIKDGYKQLSVPVEINF